jgi:galactose mutarotase-like enzyme
VPFRQVLLSGFPALALRSDEVEAIVVPTIGMKIAKLRRLDGREWLWQSDQIPLGVPRAGSSYVDTADSGGWDECFPTVGPCPLPGSSDRVVLPDHGELWSGEWSGSVLETAEGTLLTASTRGSLLPYEFERTVTLEREAPVLRLRYHLRHAGDAPFPWIWSSHPLFNVQPGTTLELAGVEQVKLDAVHGRDDVGRGDVVAWPDALGGEGGRFTFSEGPGWAVKLFGDVGADGRMVLTDPRQGERLEMRVDPGGVPQVGVWINCGGWAPSGRRPYYNLALEPCIGAPDRLDEAVNDWKLARTLHPGESVLWEVEVRLPGR